MRILGLHLYLQENIASLSSFTSFQGKLYITLLVKPGKAKLYVRQFILRDIFMGVLSCITPGNCSSFHESLSNKRPLVAHNTRPYGGSRGR
jgi:hypothetical protein